MDRRRFLLSSASAAALTACSSSNAPFAPGANGLDSLVRRAAKSKPTFTRLEIAEFSAQPKLVAAFRKGVETMRAVKDPRDVRSWAYWHYSHWMPDSNPPFDMIAVWDQCKHAQSYFQPWHRGFLYYFENILREASGNPKFALPYWDYYKNPKLPAIFTAETLEDGSPNPLYWKGRKGSAMTGLSYAPFADSVTQFPFGPGETFEDLVERNPHNRVHDQIGGAMGRVPTAVEDPIFWAHHANIDRLWSAWLAAGGKRSMPASGALWWYTNFFYNLDRSWGASVRELNDTSNFGYTYNDLSLPVAPANAALPLRPVTAMTAAATSSGPIALTLRPVTVEISIDEAMLGSSSLQVVLENVTMSAVGGEGGYDYGIYANLPTVRTPLAQERTFAVDQFGPFNISMAQIKGMKGMAMPGSSSRGATLAFPLGKLLERQRQAGVAKDATLSLSFVPFGEPAGIPANAELVNVGTIRVAS
jgi:tyrosinase